MTLNVEGLCAFYDRTQVLFDVDLRVEAGEMIGLLGRNGVGKTTLMRSLMGMVRTQERQMEWDGRQMSGLPTYQRSRLGLRYIPQDRGLFTNLTVLENLQVPLAVTQGETQLTDVYDYFPKLKEREQQQAGSLSGGERQMLAIARALLASPRLLLIDELSEGVQPNIVEQIGALLRELNRTRGLTIILVEQDAELALEWTDRAYVLEKGAVVFSGPSADLRSSRDDLNKFLLV